MKLIWLVEKRVEYKDWTGGEDLEYEYRTFVLVGFQPTLRAFFN